MAYEQLKLENQLCFPLYAASRLITREYQPHLDALGITYPQYLVLLVLWEKDGQLVTDISKKLLLHTNTITPLLQRMEKQQLIVRQRSKTDERQVIIFLSKNGQKMKDKATSIPEELAKKLVEHQLDVNDLMRLKECVDMLVKVLR